MNVVLNLSQYVHPELIEADLKAETRDEAIGRLVDLIFQRRPDLVSESLTPQELRRRVVDRETMQTTGLGDGIALPHTRIAECEDMAVAIGIHADGLDWGSVDGNPCHVIVLTVSAKEKPYLILQMTAAIVRFLSEPENRRQITSGLSAESIARLLTGRALETERTVLAHDIMKPIAASLNAETPLQDAVHQMHLNQIDVLPVVDDENILRGELSCFDIFTYGTPDFFQRLQTISFMRNLDPFERYFSYRHGLKVEDVCSPPRNVIAKDTTLMEIIFEVAVKNKQRLFVVDQGRLIGTIDRFSIIDKILFF